MPVYEYRCHRCGHRHVATLTFKEKDDYHPDCEECGTRLTQLFSPAGIVFKGSGFYRNDSRPAPPTDVSKPVKEKAKKDKAKKKEKTNDL